MQANLAGEHPVLTEPPNPAKPPQAPEADRRALAWIMGGATSAGMAAYAASPASFDAYRTPEGLTALAGDAGILRLFTPGDDLAAASAARAARLAAAIARLEGRGWTPETATAALRAESAAAA
jgi:hypothetical protein